MQLPTTFVKNKCNFLTFLLQHKLAVVMIHCGCRATWTDCCRWWAHDI